VRTDGYTSGCTAHDTATYDGKVASVKSVATALVEIDVTVWVAVATLIVTFTAIWGTVKLTLKNEVRAEIMKQRDAGLLAGAVWMRRIEQQLEANSLITTNNGKLLAVIASNLDQNIGGRLATTEKKVDELVTAVNRLVGRMDK